MRRLLASLFGCRHVRHSWPQTKAGVCYIACIDCGAELSWSWEDMKKGGHIKIEIARPRPGFREVDGSIVCRDQAVSPDISV
jgi:hypothetical protein